MQKIEQGTEVLVKNRDTGKWQPHKTQKPLLFAHGEMVHGAWLFTMIDFLIVARPEDVRKEIPMRRGPRNIAEVLSELNSLQVDHAKSDEAA